MIGTKISILVAQLKQQNLSPVMCFVICCLMNKMSPHRLYCQSKRETRLEARVVLLIDVLWSLSIFLQK